MTQRTKLQIWWHVRNPDDPIGSFAVSYRSCIAEIGAPLEHVPIRHLENIGRFLPDELQRRISQCSRVIRQFVPKAEARDFGLGEVKPTEWLEAFS